jgi:hypothetical protein
MSGNSNSNTNTGNNNSITSISNNISNSSNTGNTNNSGNSNGNVDKAVLSRDDFKRLLRGYDDDGDGSMSDKEVDRLLDEYR